MTRIFRQLAEVDCFRYGSRTCQGCVSLERREQDSSNSNLLEKFTSSLKSINGCSKRENLWGEQSRSWSPSWLRRLSIAGAAATNSGTEHQDREDAGVCYLDTYRVRKRCPRWHFASPLSGANSVQNGLFSTSRQLTAGYRR